jgi:DNA polymerase-1
LFTHLGLSSGKKTKTGFSTDEATLDKMRDEHPIIEAILDYRELFKLQSTYIEPLLELGAKRADSRIFSSFLQTGTATGRLSSKNPNLQNIPVKGSLATKLRECFVAANGKKLIAIDYSQIELRLLAHFSEDATLLAAFNNGVDIHLATAAKIFGENFAKEKRSFAKTINFGLLYGMGAQKLSATLNISTKEAKELIDGYFEGFPTVKAYLEEVKTKAKIDGYVKTLLGRKRYFGFEGANGRDLAMYEREAANTVFQGSAADLIKLSMNKIDSIILEQNLDVKMILQIHDELIFEVNADDAQSMGELFSGIMQNIYELKVPLIAEPNYGDNWGEI